MAAPDREILARMIMELSEHLTTLQLAASTLDLEGEITEDDLSSLKKAVQEMTWTVNAVQMHARREKFKTPSIPLRRLLLE